MRIYKFLHESPFLQEVNVPFNMKNETFDHMYYAELPYGTTMKFVTFNDHPWDKSRKHILPVQQYEIKQQQLQFVPEISKVNAFHVVNIKNVVDFTIPSSTNMDMILLDFTDTPTTITCNLDETPNIHYLSTNCATHIELISSKVENTYCAITPNGSKVTLRSRASKNIKSIESTTINTNLNYDILLVMDEQIISIF